MINLFFSLFKIVYIFMKILTFIDSARLFFFALQHSGFSFPSQGLNPMPPALGMQILNHWTASCCCVASVVSDSVQPHRRQPTRPPRPWDSPGKNTGVGCHFLLQCMKVKSESEVAQLCLTLATSWTAAHQAPLSMGFSRQKYWSGVPLPSPWTAREVPKPYIIMSRMRKSQDNLTLLVQVLTGTTTLGISPNIS